MVTMGRGTSVVRAVVLATVVGVAASPGAWPASPPVCTFEANLVIDPGLSAAPSAGTFETAPEQPGTYRCQGFGSEQSGAAGTEGRYGTRDLDGCTQGGEGIGALRFGDGADEGTDFTFTYTPFSDEGVATGTFEGDGFEGTFRLTTANGDCDAEQVTKVRLEGEGTVRP